MALAMMPCHHRTERTQRNGLEASSSASLACLPAAVPGPPGPGSLQLKLSIVMLRVTVVGLLLTAMSWWCDGVPTVDAAVPVAQVNALTDLYSATVGAAWTTSTNWLAGDPCAAVWYGVGCLGTDVT